MQGQSEKQLINLLEMAYSAELAAAYAYRGHWHSVRDPDEKIRIRKIEDEEWHHRRLVGEMLATLNARPSRLKEVKAVILGRVLGVLCHLSGWLAPMYGAGRLESRNIREYETAARFARDSGHESFIDCLLTMAEVEWEHEFYFRSRVASHRWAAQLPIWLQPPPRENIRLSFERELRLQQRKY
jgi:demethoxyubiquinone hydroxylase (CLK1/Coq7/Cat5 family)